MATSVRIFYRQFVHLLFFQTMQQSFTVLHCLWALSHCNLSFGCRFMPSSCLGTIPSENSSEEPELTFCNSCLEANLFSFPSLMIYYSLYLSTSVCNSDLSYLFWGVLSLCARRYTSKFRHLLLHRMTFCVTKRNCTFLPWRRFSGPLYTMLLYC